MALPVGWIDRGLEQMNLNSINAAAAMNPVEPISKAAQASQPGDAMAIVDTVEISTAARLAAMAQELPDVRTDLVAKVKAELAAGVYETPDKIEVAIERLLDDLLA